MIQIRAVHHHQISSNFITATHEGKGAESANVLLVHSNYIVVHVRSRTCVSTSTLNRVLDKSHVIISFFSVV
jgi:hypothetical protein